MKLYIAGLFILVCIFIGSSLLVLQMTAPKPIPPQSKSSIFDAIVPANKNADHTGVSKPTITSSATSVSIPSVSLKDIQGFVVIQEDSSGGPGTILGVSGFLEAGQYGTVEISLFRPVKSGERIYIAIYQDIVGSAVFEAPNTTAPYKDDKGNPVIVSVTAP